MLLDLLREIEDQNVKLGSCLERGDVEQGLTHHTRLHSLLIEAAVLVLRAEQREGRTLT
jgi:hypothetical protein